MAAVELPGAGGQSARAVWCMGVATGYVLAVLRLRQVAVVEVLAEDVKLAACNCPGASKAAVMDAARARWNYDWPTTKADMEHAADAAWAADHVLAQGGPLVRLLTPEQPSLFDRARARRSAL